MVQELFKSDQFLSCFNTEMQKYKFPSYNISIDWKNQLS